MKCLYAAIPAHLVPEDCDIIKSRYSHDLKPGSIDTNDSINQNSHRKSFVTFLRDPDITHMLLNLAKEVNKSHFGFSLYDSKPDVQFTEYNSKYKGEYNWHMDTLFNENIWERKLSIVLQLSDPNDYEGGDFLISSSGEKTAENITLNDPQLKKQGSAILFPSFVQHKISPVTKGVRNSLVTWIDGPHWQ